MPEDQTQSPDLSTGNLASALSRAQGEIEPPLKNRKVDFLDRNGRRVKYNYADLADVMKAIREPFAKVGLSIHHVMAYTDQMFGLTTFLNHGPSGDHVSTWYPLPDPRKGEIKAQEFGSALTYARRYSVSSLTGVASEEDDDGQEAPPTTPPEPTKKTVTPPQGSRPTSRPTPPAAPSPKAETAAEAVRKPGVVRALREDQARASMPPTPPNIAEADLAFDQQFPEGDVDQSPPAEGEPVTLLDKLVALAFEYSIPNERMSQIIRQVTGTGKRSVQLDSNELTKVINWINLTQQKPK